MKAKEVRRRVNNAALSGWSTVYAERARRSVLTDIVAAQAETIELLAAEVARMDERESQHLDTHIRVREAADRLADRVNDLDEFAGIGGSLEARVKVLEARPCPALPS